ncbi:hypothetical protein KSW81_006633 [Nannochloris sp. 'desiccata']|nr:hypothetical protein KSW81_006633 [Chlorella desiccata (nom. nud.)]
MPDEMGRVIAPLQTRPNGGTPPAPTPAAATTAAAAAAVPSAPAPPEPITLRIVSLDYYMAPPVPGMDVCWSVLEGVAVQKVPVIYPYFYIPYDDDMPQDTSGAIAYARRLALSLDAALSFSNSSNAPGPAVGNNEKRPAATTAAAAAAAGGGVVGSSSSSRRQRVFGGTLVRGIPFYGYHPEERPFIKLILYDPKDVKKAASLLLAGAVLGRSFQPYESHVPYLLQFKIDLNLQGMGYLTLSKGMFRGKLPSERAVHRQGWAQREIFQTEDGDSCDGPGRLPGVPSPGTSASPLSTSSSLQISTTIWLESTTPVAMRWGRGSGDNIAGAAPPQRQTTCDLEFDGHAEDILNRNLLLKMPLAHAGPEIRMVESLAPMWEEERKRCGGSVPQPAPDVPRTPQQLSSAVAQCREEFQVIEEQIKDALGMVPDGIEEAPLLNATQAANEAVFPLSQALPSAAGGVVAADVAVKYPVDYGQFIDEDILTQMSVEDEDLGQPLGRPSSAAAAPGGGGGGGDGFPRVEAEEIFARQHGDGIDEEEEDLLLALAMQLTPASLPTKTEVPAAAAAAAAAMPFREGVTPSQDLLPVPQLTFSAPNSQQETYRRAQNALEQFLAATQRECDDILECSAPQQHPDDDNDINGIDNNNNDDGEQQRQQQLQQRSYIPQVDGGFDDSSPVPSGADPEIAEEKADDDMQIDQPVPVAAAAVVHSMNHPPTRTEAYVPRERVRISGQYLSASMRFLGAQYDDDDEDEVIEEAAEKQKQQEKNVTLGQIVLSADLPPTQPLENTEDGMEEGQVGEEIREEEDFPIEPSPAAEAPLLNSTYTNNGAQSNGDWWHEEASQIPFEDLEWDLLDDDLGGGGGGGDGGDIPEDTLDNDGDAHSEEEQLQEEENQGEKKLQIYYYHRPAPTQADLLSSGWDQGILPIVHQGAHYSKRAHVPARAPIFAGKEFKVPCSAAGELPEFSGIMEKARSGAGTGAYGIARTLLNKERMAIRGLIAFTPARKPPSRAETDAWLGLSNTSNSVKGGGAVGKRGNEAGFTMDPNTGRLIPSRQKGGGGASANTSQPLSGGGGSAVTGGGAGDLLGTPSLASIPSSDPRKRVKSLQQHHFYNTPEINMLGGVEKSLDGNGDADGRIGNGKKEEEEEEEREELRRPPSPKYDEASFFYNNPFISDAAPSIRGAGSGGAGMSRSRLSTQGEKNTVPVGTSPALGSNNPACGDIGAKSIPGPMQILPQLHPVSTRKSALKPPQQPPHNVDISGAVDPSQDKAAPAEIKGKKVVAFTPEDDDQVAAKNAAVAAPGPSKPKPKARSQFVSQITPPSHGGGKIATPSSQLGFKRIIAGKGQGLTLASIEVHAECRGQLLPDPRYDAVRAVVIAVTDDEEDVPDGNFFARIFLFDGETTTTTTTVPAAEGAAEGAAPPHSPHPPTGNIPNEPLRKLSSTVDGLTGCQIERFPTEETLFDAVVAAVCALDPDIVLGYEIQKDSIGYLSDRAAVAFKRNNFLKELSRMPGDEKVAQAHQQKDHHDPDGGKNNDDAVGGGGGGGGGGVRDQYGWDHASGLDIPGRIVLNVWRLMRGELKLNIYTLENCAAAVLRLRIPHIPAPQLSSWFSAGPSGGRWRCLSHLTLRARLSLALLDRLDLVGRTSEMARAFGIDFFSVLSRGSQYRVESMTLRLAHSQNYVAVAPSPEQVARQPAMEALPLVMEPRSAMYPDPVCVLDFQSLYPSMIIAYNLCYSTCIGKPAHSAAAAAAVADGTFSTLSSYKIKLGCSEYVTPPQALAGGKPGANGLVIAPNRVAFIPSEVRPGVLPRLLNEILSTRIMVKAAMKRAPSSLRVLLRCLNARQFGLKLIANVTYGYTAAGFSGRMPMAELADAIVQSGRATLEAAIAMVENHPTWKANVVYGDTDSLFVQLPGRTVEEAFAIGAEIAAAVTAANPPPVTLKLEKVYRPCVLLSKKRYVGAMYEYPGQKVPAFDAKGIETVRRDACPAVAKIMEKTLRLLFASGDLSAVRMYLEKQWTRILSGRVSISDFIFAKEVRLGTYSTRAGVVPPAALVATRAMASDPRAEPRYGERVPYVVVYGEPGARLADMVVPPRALVESGGRLRLHAVYYITKQIIPAIERALSLVGADVRAWFAAMPRPQRTLPQKRPQESLPLLPDNGGLGISTRGGGGGGGAANVNHFYGAGALTIDRFYLSRHCAVCDELTHASKPLCERCLTEPQLAAAVLSSRCNRLGRQYTHLVKVCGACGGGGGTLNVEEGGIVCDSLDCGVYFERRKVWREMQAGEALAAAGLSALVPCDI